MRFSTCKYSVSDGHDKAPGLYPVPPILSFKNAKIQFFRIQLISNNLCIQLLVFRMLDRKELHLC